MRSAVLLLLFLLTPIAAIAQVAGSTVTVVATHDGVFTDWYELFVNNVLAQSRPVSDLAMGEIRFPYTLPPRGNYTLFVRARNDDGEFADSDPLAFTTTRGKPNKPGKPRFITSVLTGWLAIPRRPAEMRVTFKGE